MRPLAISAVDIFLAVSEECAFPADLSTVPDDLLFSEPSNSPSAIITPLASGPPNGPATTGAPRP